MISKVFTDTNIIIDFLEQREFDLELLNQLFYLAESGSLELYVSESVITNALYISKLPDQTLRLLNFINVICIEKNVIQTALGSTFIDKEDAILYHGAFKNGMNCFLTRNKKHFDKYIKKELPLYTVKEFFKIFYNDN
jgi:predicted nucleic acid-binding protein